MTENRDPIVTVSITCLERAIARLKAGDKYNNEEITLADYFPFGVQDHITKVNEAILRLHALQQGGSPTTRLLQEAEDVLGHAALGVAHISMGLYKGKLGLEIENLAEGICVGRKESIVKDQSITEKNSDSPTDDTSGSRSADQK